MAVPRIEARDAGRTLCGVNREAAMGGRRRGGLGVLPSAVLARLEMVCVVGGEGERDEERRRASSGEVEWRGRQWRWCTDRTAHLAVCLHGAGVLDSLDLQADDPRDGHSALCRRRMALPLAVTVRTHRHRTRG